jgi:NADH:ubiquinone oxidoreductase subunit 6 (subunit J)
MYPPGRHSALHLAGTALAVALLLYLAVKLILAVLPLLIAFGAVGLVGLIGWSVHSRHRSGW